MAFHEAAREERARAEQEVRESDRALAAIDVRLQELRRTEALGTHVADLADDVHLAALPTAAPERDTRAGDLAEWCCTAAGGLSSARERLDQAAALIDSQAVELASERGIECDDAESTAAEFERVG